MKDSMPDDLYFEAVRELEGGLSSRAEALVSKLATLEPDSERSTILRAQLLEQSGDLQEAATLLENFSRKNLKSGFARGNLARLQWRLGEVDRALATLRFALAQQPNQERILHFYAGLLEEKHGFPHAVNSLLGLAQAPGAWLPAWVAAVLAGVKGEEELCATALQQCAGTASSFPPSPETLLKLLNGLSDPLPLWQRLRPCCTDPARALIDDAIAASPPMHDRAPEEEVRGSVVGGPAAHPLLAGQPAVCLLTPVRLIKPGTWGAEEIEGPLGRGLSLLLAELLVFRQRIVAETVFLCTPDAGLHLHKSLPSIESLVGLASPHTRFILSAYLSRKAGGEFTLDCERYDAGGAYLGHLTAQSDEPGACVSDLATLLAGPIPVAELNLPAWTPNLELESMLARDTAAAFLLCRQGCLSPRAIPNPGLSLDLLAEHAAGSQNPLDLVTYWNAVCAAEQMQVPSAAEQRQLVSALLAKDPVFAPWSS